VNLWDVVRDSNTPKSIIRVTEALRPSSEQALARGVSRTEAGIECEDGEPVLYIEPR
jgi:hypothetical protein